MSEPGVSGGCVADPVARGKGGPKRLDTFTVPLGGATSRSYQPRLMLNALWRVSIVNLGSRFHCRCCPWLPLQRKRPAMSRPLSTIVLVRERQTAAVIHCCNFCFGAAPTWREAISPPLKIIRVGIDITPYFEAVFGLSSTFSFTILTLSPITPEISSSAGAIIRQGPHHSAQKSTTTGPVALSTSASKSASETLPTAIGIPRSVWKNAALRNRRLIMPSTYERGVAGSSSLIPWD